jgi:signal transduction histidine kinase
MHITLESMAAGVGLIHFLNEKRDAFHLEIQKGLPPELGIGLQNISTKSGFWSRLSNSTSPIVINDTAGENNLPQEFSVLYDQGQRAFIGAPIRAKGNVLGLLSLFDRSILDYTIEDITLFMTIADQIGSLVERARLMKQAEIAAVVQERQRLARELHDSVTQLLYSQVLFSGAGLKVLQQGDIDTTRDHLERINQAALQALKEMRLLVYQLRPSDYLEEGLVGALTRRLDAVEKRTGINARLVVEGELGIDEAVEMSLYRIAEEALNNTLKHAQASTVTITLRAFDSRVILEIADNGIGFDPQDSELRGLREAGMGLKNMQERTALMGGKIEIYSKPGKGTRVTVEIEFQP